MVRESHAVRHTIDRDECTNATRLLWLKLYNIQSNEQAWYIIQEAFEHEVKEAIEKYVLKSAILQKGMEGSGDEESDKERKPEDLPEEA